MDQGDTNEQFDSEVRKNNEEMPADNDILNYNSGTSIVIQESQSIDKNNQFNNS